MLEEIESLVPIGSVVHGINTTCLAVVMGEYVVDRRNPDEILCSVKYIDGTDRGLVTKEYFLARCLLNGGYQLAVEIINKGRFTVVCKEIK
jgi:hypothetical protein